MSERETVVIVDYGSQYTRLIARRVRELRVYAEVVPWTADAAWVQALNLRGFILSGGPNSVYDEGASSLPGYVLKEDVPVLGMRLVTWTPRSAFSRPSPASPLPRRSGASSVSSSSASSRRRRASWRGYATWGRGPSTRT